MEGVLVSYGVEWLHLLVRWLHLIAGIAWIGASFYFVWLDNAIRPPRPGSDLAGKGVSGELWAVHGGGFYHPQKYLVAPSELPEELHWFKWEAYVTWISGMAMLIIVYYFNTSAMMVDKSVADLSTVQSIGIGLGTLVLGWIVYDLLCRSPLQRRDDVLGIAMFMFIVAMAYALTHLLSGRAAYIHVGAMIGTIMAGNVLMVIIPCQRRLVAAMKARHPPDPAHGKKGKQRSMHNNYFTLPVLFIMISNHYAMTYNHAYSWLVLAAIMAAGVLIRHFFNLRHTGRALVRLPVAACALLLGVAVAIAPKPPSQFTAAQAGASFDRVQDIVMQRCAGCHSSKPTQAGFAAAPAGMLLQTPELIRQHAARVYQRAVQTKDMPLANITHMTSEERALIGAWFEAGVR